MIDWQSIWQVIAHNWALISILLTLLVLLIVPTLILWKYVRICLNILRDTEPPLSMTQVGFTVISGDERDFHSEDGIRLRGTFHHPSTARPRGLVLFAPEFKSTRQSWSRYCRPLLEAGYDIFSLDFRGHGESGCDEGYTPRQWPSDREVMDLRAALTYCEHWLEDRGRPIEIGLFGISRGACTSILVAEEHPSVRCIITDGAFSSDRTLEHLMKRWAYIFAKVRVVYENHPPEFWQFLRWCLFLTCRFKLNCVFPSVRKSLMRLPPRPMLFIHGERDSYIPVEQTRLLYALAAQPKYLWIVHKAKHNQSVDMRPAEYSKRIVDFFDRYLAREPAPENLFKAGRLEQMVRSTRVGRIAPASITARTRLVGTGVDNDAASAVN